MIIASRLFTLMGLFGLGALVLYFGWTQGSRGELELAGLGLLAAFFFACLFVGAVLWTASPANRRRQPVPDTGLRGSAHPERGAADEHGNIHLMGNSSAPVVFALAGTALLLGLLGAANQSSVGIFWLASGMVLFLAATAIWYRAVVADTRAALEGAHGGHGAAGHGSGHGAAVEEVEAEPAGPPSPANWFEQLREACEVGDPDWAADAYTAGAVYYEPANPPHEGREAIRAYLNDFLKAHRDLRWTVQRIGVDGNVAIAEWTWSFRRRDGRWVTDQPGVTVIEAGPDGITYHRDYL